MNSRSPMRKNPSIIILSLTGLPGNHLKKQASMIIMVIKFIGEKTFAIASPEAENRAIPTPFF